METGTDSQQVKTLMDSYERLTVIYDRMNNLTGMSGKVVRKFDRTENMVTEKTKEGLVKPPQPHVSDIVELFNDKMAGINQLIDAVDRDISNISSRIE